MLDPTKTKKKSSRLISPKTLFYVKFINKLISIHSKMDSCVLNVLLECNKKINNIQQKRMLFIRLSFLSNSIMVNKC